MIKFNISFMDKNGLRTLSGPNQGRYFKDTREEAEKHLRDFLTNNSEERLADIYGKQAIGTFRVDEFDCYDHGDAKGIYVDIGPQEPCPRCGMMHLAGDYVARPDLKGVKDGMPHCPPDVLCTCGALLRHSVPLFKVSMSGWVWRIL